MPEPSSSTNERRSLRKHMRQQRRNLNAQARQKMDNALVQHIRALGTFKAARRLAIFLAFDGEPELQQLLQTEIIRRKQIFAPVIRGDSMHFAELTADSGLYTNFFGIQEPEYNEFVDMRSLDLVLTPLVAFDDHGTRLGVGRAYYDRCFHTIRERKMWLRPKLLGVAYSFQQITFIEPQAWDVPLWGVVTENGVNRFLRKSPDIDLPTD